MKVAVTFTKAGEVLHKEVGEVDSTESWEKLAAFAFRAFRRKHPDISLFDGVTTHWDREEVND